MEILGLLGKQLLVVPFQILERNDYHRADPPTKGFSRPCKVVDEANKEVLIMHYPGSNGEPKPIYWTNKRLSTIYGTPLRLSCLNTFQLWHVNGLILCLSSLYSQQTFFMYNPHIPLTAENICQTLGAAKPRALLTTSGAFEALLKRRESMKMLQLKPDPGSGNGILYEPGALLMRNYGISVRNTT